MNKLVFKIKKFIAYRKLKKIILPVLNEPSSKMVQTKHINSFFILAFLIDLVKQKSDAVLIIDDEFNLILSDIPELKQLRIFTPHEWSYSSMKHTFVLCSPLSENNFDIVYSKSIIDADNYYIMLL